MPVGETKTTLESYNTAVNSMCWKADIRYMEIGQSKSHILGKAKKK